MHKSSENRRYATCPHWIELAEAAAHRAQIAASFDDEVSDDWLGDEDEFDAEEVA